MEKVKKILKKLLNDDIDKDYNYLIVEWLLKYTHYIFYFD